MNKVLLIKIIPEENAFRWYRITRWPLKVMCEWGRVDGSGSGQSLEIFKEEGDAQKAFDKALAKRQKRGYSISENTNAPTMAESNCPWCKNKAPQQMEGFVVVPFPAHFERRKTDVATRAKWWARIDEIAEMVGGHPDVIFPDEPHAIALVMGSLDGQTDIQPVDKKTSRPRSRTNVDAVQLKINWLADSI